MYHNIKKTRVIDITHIHDDGNPTEIKKKDLESIDSFIRELPILDGVDTSSILSLDFDTPYIYSDTSSVVDPLHELSLSRMVPPSQSTQPPLLMIIFFKVAFMTLANHSNITRLVIDIPQFIHTAIEWTHAHFRVRMVEYKLILSMVEARKDS